MVLRQLSQVNDAKQGLMSSWLEWLLKALILKGHRLLLAYLKQEGDRELRLT